MPTSTASWWVLGQGALGLMLASRLHQHGHPVALKLRGALTSADSRKDYRYCDHNDAHANHGCLSTAISLPIANAITPIPSVIFAAIKAYDVNAFIQQYKDSTWGAKAAQPPLLILSYNGMLDDEAQLFSGIDVRQLSTTQAAYFAAGVLHHTGYGESSLATANETTRRLDSGSEHEIITALQTCIPPLKVVQDIERTRWLKLAINAIVNPLTAIHKIPNGDLADSAFYAEKNKLCEEFCVIAAAAGFNFAKAEIMNKLDRVIKNTASNYSSMLQDVQLGRRTEIDYVTGFLVRKAQQFEIAAPAHQALLQQFQQSIEA